MVNMNLCHTSFIKSPVMSSVSDILGQYMLQGWVSFFWLLANYSPDRPESQVLTDRSCPSPGCSVPMMRSPSGRSPVIEFCASCSEIPGGSPLSYTNIQSFISLHTGPQAKPSASVSDSSSTFTSHISRSSTPPTDISSALSSPVFAPPIETEESLRRREQSDRASAEIGKRLLKGWAMLGDECINTRCYGVPLVRPPKVGGEKNPRKVCHVSNTRFVDFNIPQGVRHLWNSLRL
jgi:hypothetical protein